MLYKKSLMMSICIVFSCAGMNSASQEIVLQGTALQETALQEIAQQLSTHVRPAFNDVGSQALHQSVSTHDLAQRVAHASLATSRMAKGAVCADDFRSVQEDMKTLLRGFYPHENNTLTQGLSPRVLAAVYCVLAQACTHLVDGEQKFNELKKPSSLSLAEKKLLCTAQIILFKQLVNGLFASIDHKGKLYGDEPHIATEHVVVCDADGAMLAGIEALECFSQATNDNESLCASCKNSPQELWCSDCVHADRAHSQITPYVHTVARETESRVGVNNALWYLQSHVGGESLAVDEYAENNAEQKWLGCERLQVRADMRRLLLQFVRLHKNLIDDAKRNKELSANLIQQPSTSAVQNTGGVFGGLVQGLNSWNPLTLLQAKAGSIALTKTLGIDEKYLPQLGELLESFSRVGGFDKDSTFLVDSFPDVERFATLYRKPLREQLLSSDCSKQFDVLAHAWKTGGIDASGLRLIKNVSHQPGDNEQKEGKKVGANNGKI